MAKLTRLLNITSSLKVKASLKLKILSRYILSQLTFELKTYDLPLTWVDQSMDAKCTDHIRSWLELPVSACVSEALRLPPNRTGVGLVTFKHLAMKMRLDRRNSLRTSRREVMRRIWEESRTLNVKADSLLTSSGSATAATKLSIPNKFPKRLPTCSVYSAKEPWPVQSTRHAPGRIYQCGRH